MRHSRATQSKQVGQKIFLRTHESKKLPVHNIGRCNLERVPLPVEMNLQRDPDCNEPIMGPDRTSGYLMLSLCQPNPITITQLPNQLHTTQA